jgi:hypothetical protein
MLQTTVHRILRKSPRLKQYKLQVVHKLRARDKKLRLQSATILKHDNFLSLLSSLMRKNFKSLEVSIDITVSFGAVSAPENMNRTVLK